MSHHEEEGNETMSTPRQKVIHNPTPTYIFVLTSKNMFIYKFVFVATSACSVY